MKMRLFSWIWAQIIELFVFIILICLYFASFFRKKIENRSGKNRPILLVHGYINSSFVWEFHEKYLSQKGIGPIFTIDLGNPFRSISEYAELVSQKVKEIAKLTGNPQITLIGHSMGGLICYYYAAKLAPPHTVSQIITIASPLSGTRASRIGIGKCAREMEINSSFIKELHLAIGALEKEKLFNIATMTDELVVPYSSSFFHSLKQNRLCLSGIGHASLLFSRRASEKLYQWLVENSGS